MMRYVDTCVENIWGVRDHINSARFIMVALDEKDMPVHVPRLMLQTEEEHTAWYQKVECRKIRNRNK